MGKEGVKNAVINIIIDPYVTFKYIIMETMFS